MEKDKSTNPLTPLWVFIAIAFGVLLGFTIKNMTSGKKVFTSTSSMSEVDEVLMYIQEKYVDSVDINQLEDDAIVQTLKELDPHSVFLSREILSRENEQMDGEYEGIGIEFFIVEDTVTVVTAMSGGPSESVGIHAGDKIITVNDSTIAGTGIQNSDVVSLLKGKKGTKVDVGIKRGSQNNLLDFEITRAAIPINSIDLAYMITDKTGYIKINRFSKETYKEFQIELDKLVKKGMQNLIVDLRDNSGGIMKDALEILDELIDGHKLLLSAEGRKYKHEDYNARVEGNFEKGKVAILINEGSASASEIVAGAIQDWDRGVIVGRRSFGKGLVQQSYQLSDGSAIRLTVARYFTPSGRLIQRSYEDGAEQYYEQFYNRNGELFSKDSIKLDSALVKYTLVNQREVFGGGGIVPDIFVPIDTSGVTEFSRAVYSKGILQQFVYDYYADHDSDFSGFDTVESFEDQYFVSNSLYNRFVSYAQKQLGKSYKSRDIITAKKDISEDIKALFAKQLFGSEGLFRIENLYDQEIARTIEVFSDGNYESVLEGIKQ